MNVVEGEKNLVGHIVVEHTDGYGGPMEIATRGSPDGMIEAVSLTSHKDTPTFIQMLGKKRFF